MSPELLRELADVFEAESLEHALGVAPESYYGVRSTINVGRAPDYAEADRLEAIADELRARAAQEEDDGTRTEHRACGPADLERHPFR